MECKRRKTSCKHTCNVHSQDVSLIRNSQLLFHKRRCALAQPNEHRAHDALVLLVGLALVLAQDVVVLHRSRSAAFFRPRRRALLRDAAHHLLER